MEKKISLKETEREVYRRACSDGLWDVLVGCYFLTFAIAPFLSPSLGDFWSSALLLPICGVILFAIWLIRRHVITPRIGRVQFGPQRKGRLTRFSIVMLAFNVVVFVLSLLSAGSVGITSRETMTMGFGFILLAGFSLAGYFLDFSRLYLYGLLLGISPPLGEWLFAQGRASHHGFPITFGTVSAVMIIVGLTLFVRLLRQNPLPTDAVSQGEMSRG